MKKLWIMFLLGVPSVVLASVVPSEPVVVKKPAVIRADATKKKVMVTREVLSDEVGSGSVEHLKRYGNVLTVDNVKSIETMSRLMQDDPAKFVKAVSGAEVSNEELGMDRRKMGTDELVQPYVKTKQTDDAGQKYASLHVPELTGSYEGARASKEELKVMHAQALEQMEKISQQHLGQKQAPIQMRLDAEEIKKMGIDTRALPKDWEKILAEQKELQEKVRASKLQKQSEQSLPPAEKVQQTTAKRPANQPTK